MLIELCAVGHDDKCNRAFVPTGVRLSDHRRLRDAGQGNDMVFEVDRRNPLATGLNQVFRAVGNHQILFFVDFCYVAGNEPAVVKFLGLWIVIVFGSDPGSTNTKFANGFAVMRLAIPFFVENFNLKARHGEACFRDVFELLVFTHGLLRVFRALAR